MMELVYFKNIFRVSVGSVIAVELFFSHLDVLFGQVVVQQII